MNASGSAFQHELITSVWKWYYYENTLSQKEDRKFFVIQWCDQFWSIRSERSSYRLYACRTLITLKTWTSLVQNHIIWDLIFTCRWSFQRFQLSRTKTSKNYAMKPFSLFKSLSAFHVSPNTPHSRWPNSNVSETQTAHISYHQRQIMFRLHTTTSERVMIKKCLQPSRSSAAVVVVSRVTRTRRCAVGTKAEKTEIKIKNKIFAECG